MGPDIYNKIAILHWQQLKFYYCHCADIEETINLEVLLTFQIIYLNLHTALHMLNEIENYSMHNMKQIVATIPLRIDKINMIYLHIPSTAKIPGKGAIGVHFDLLHKISHTCCTVGWFVIAQSLG